MGSNASAPKLQARELPAPLVLFGGLNAFFKRRTDSKRSRMCTIGFAVKRMGNHRNFKRGYLTNAACAEDIRGNSFSIHNAFVNRPDDRGELESVKIGIFDDAIYDPNRGSDYAIPYSVINVVGPASAAKGHRVCFFSEFSGRRMRIGGIEVGFAMVSYFNSMVKVRMEATPYSQANPQFDGIDGGTPVFLPVSRDRRLVAAQPVVSSLNLINDSLVVNSTNMFGWVIGENFTETATKTDPLVKREATYPCAGYPVVGISFGEGNQPYEVSCSLSFPVVDKNGKRGFLISFICAEVKQAKENSSIDEVVTYQKLILGLCEVQQKKILKYHDSRNEDLAYLEEQWFLWQAAKCDFCRLSTSIKNTITEIKSKRGLGTLFGMLNSREESFLGELEMLSKKVDNFLNEINKEKFGSNLTFHLTKKSQEQAENEIKTLVDSLKLEKELEKTLD
ncbi:594_t:CDS:2 [Paraglomus occultum]|uniref:594_t:CDS:1 n=1 Tax=Paraglomus occultum TaxID=144539 RepID=A0A9N9BG81_9GLOM|nr:594_t:CDS:2 [Paraglomus occultum]